MPTQLTTRQATSSSVKPTRTTTCTSLQDSLSSPGSPRRTPSAAPGSGAIITAIPPGSAGLMDASLGGSWQGRISPAVVATRVEPVSPLSQAPAQPAELRRRYWFTMTC